MAIRLDVSVPAGPLLSSLPSDLPSDVDQALQLATRLGALDDLGALDELGVSDDTDGPSARDEWETLATLAAHDLGVARAIEPHLDALGILREARAAGMDGNDCAGPDGMWGVFAAEGGPDPLLAHPGSDGLWLLTGTKPWCSLADRLDAALITAGLADGSSRLFRVDLRAGASAGAVDVATGAWHSRGLIEIPSGPVTFASAPAHPVGEPGWYLARPGFHRGGIGVAACWYGGAVGLARTVRERAQAKPDPFVLMHLGAIDEQLHASRLALADAASRADAGETDLRILAKRTRAVVARACEDVLVRAGHALGPAPLALDAGHAKRVADLTVYIRQHHAERDLESLGHAVSADEVTPW